jgi:hypothetical protein
MPLEEEDIAKITALLGEALKPVVSRLDKVEAVDTSKLVADAMAALAPKKEEKPKKGDDEGAARMAALEAKLAEAETSRKAADDARKSATMLGSLRTELLAKGVPAARVDHAIAHLHHAQKRVAIGDDNRATLRFDRTSAGGAYEDHLALGDGVKEWLGTEDGKSFLPASDARGAEAAKGRAGVPRTSGGKIDTPALISKVLSRAVRA